MTRTKLEQEIDPLREQVAELERQLARQKQTQLALQASNELLQSVLNNLPDAAYRRNLRTDRYDFLGPVIEQLTGWTVEEMNRADIETVLARIHPDDLLPVQQEIERTNRLCQETGRAMGVVEYRFLTKAGGYRWLGDYLTVIAGDDGQPLYRLGVVRDITERKRAEEAQQESLAKLEHLFEILPVGISVLNHHRQVVKQNPALENIVGMSADGLGRGDYYERRYIRPDGSPMPAEEFASSRVIRGEPSALNVETGIVKEDGSLTWTSINAAAVPFSDWSVVIVTQDITAKKQAEQALQASQQNLAALIENTDASIWSVDRQYRMIVGNQLYHHNVRAAIGRSLAPGENVLSLHLPQTALDEWRGYYDRALAGETFSTEASTRFTGEVQTVEYRFNPIRTSEGQITGVTVFGRNITERKRAEEALERMRNTLVEAQKIARVGSFEYVAMTQTTVWSEVEYDIYGLDPTGPSPAYDVMIKQCIHPDDAPLLHKTFTEAIQSLSVYELEHRVVRPDGSIRWVYDRAHPYLDKYGNLVRYIGTTLDITERKQAEERLRESEAQMSTIFESSPIAIGISRISDGRITHLNTAFEKLYGYSRAEVLGSTTAALNIWEVSADRQRFIESLKAEGVCTLESIARLKSGDNRDVLVSGRVVTINGELCAMAQIMDITQRKHMENELRRSNAELEQFAYIASHDLQEPLRAVIGMVQLLQRRYLGRLDEQADEYIELTVESAYRMQNLINDLLTYSRVGRRGKALEPVSAGTCLQLALQNLMVPISESQAIITFDDLPTITADSTQLTQLFQNLIGNSLKFRGNRQPQIHISAVKTEQGWQFLVRDNGIGIEPQYFERIFQVFQRLHLREEYPGTGIGLALCQKIVERHGGRIWVESQVGQGSTFYFTLPR